MLENEYVQNTYAYVYIIWNSFVIVFTFFFTLLEFTALEFSGLHLLKPT